MRTIVFPLQHLTPNQHVLHHKLSKIKSKVWRFSLFSLMTHFLCFLICFLCLFVPLSFPWLRFGKGWVRSSQSVHKKEVNTQKSNLVCVWGTNPSHQRSYLFRWVRQIQHQATTVVIHSQVTFVLMVSKIKGVTVCLGLFTLLGSGKMTQLQVKSMLTLVSWVKVPPLFKLHHSAFLYVRYLNTSVHNWEIEGLGVSPSSKQM